MAPGRRDEGYVCRVVALCPKLVGVNLGLEAPVVRLVVHRPCLAIGRPDGVGAPHSARNVGFLRPAAERSRSGCLVLEEVRPTWVVGWEVVVVVCTVVLQTEQKLALQC